MSSAIVQALGATAEVMGHRLSDAALNLMADDLESYPAENVAKALKRVRQDGTRFTVAEVIKRLPGMWPGAETAWAQFPRDEVMSACICQEMADAWGVASGLDEVAGRMAFRESYNRSVSEALAEGKTPRWFISPGTDAQIREQVTLDAVSANLITTTAAQVHLPHIPVSEIQLLATHETTTLAVIENNAQVLLPSAVDDLLPTADAINQLQDMLARLRA